MIIITSEVTFQQEHWEEALELAQKHVSASRLEDGCISHRCLISPEKKHCVFFYEEWKDRASIDYHFKQSYSLKISKKFRQWATNEIELKFHKVE